MASQKSYISNRLRVGKVIVKKLILFLCNLLTPGIVARKAEVKILGDIVGIKNNQPTIDSATQIEIENVLDDLGYYYKENADNRKIIEDKAKATLLVLTVTISFIVGTLNYLYKIDLTSITGLVTTIFLILGVSYLIWSAVLTIKTINISEYFVITQDEQYKIVDNKFTINVLNNHNKATQLYVINTLNQKINQIKANYLYSSLICIRNGVLSIGIFFFLTTITYYIPKNYTSVDHNVQSDSLRSVENSLKFELLKTRATFSDSCLKLIEEKKERRLQTESQCATRPFGKKK